MMLLMSLHLIYCLQESRSCASPRNEQGPVPELESPELVYHGGKASWCSNSSWQCIYQTALGVP